MSAPVLEKDIESALQEESRFHCEKFRCQMSVKACISRQGVKGVKLNEIAGQIKAECQGCERGKEIAERFKDTVRQEETTIEMTPVYACPPKESSSPSIIKGGDGKGTKVCGRCKIEKPVSCFSRHKKQADGLQNWCKDCITAYYKDRREMRKKTTRKRLAMKPHQEQIGISNAREDKQLSEPDISQKYKRCSACKEHKPFGQFSKNCNNKDGLQRICKPCSVDLNRQYRKKHREDLRTIRNRGKHIIALDFSDRPELLENLQKSAGNAFRTPEMHALWIIKRHITGQVAAGDGQ